MVYDVLRNTKKNHENKAEDCPCNRAEPGRFTMNNAPEQNQQLFGNPNWPVFDSS